MNLNLLIFLCVYLCLGIIVCFFYVWYKRKIHVNQNKSIALSDLVGVTIFWPIILTVKFFLILEDIKI